MKDIHCPICGLGVSYKLRYPARINNNSVKFVARKTPECCHFQVVQCHGCGLVYSTPIFERDKIAELYKNSEFINEFQLENMASDYLEEFLKVKEKINGEAVLEIGCANGFFIQRLKDIGIKNVYGIEPSVSAYEAAPSDIQDKIINKEFMEGIFQEESFDIILFFQVFDHIVEPNEFLQLVHRYLKKGGILVAIHHDIKSLLPTILGERASTYDLSHIYLWDKNTMRLILEKNDFEVLYIRNIANRYQVDHIIRMLPLPNIIRIIFRVSMERLRLSDKNIRLFVENMVCVARK